MQNGRIPDRCKRLAKWRSLCEKNPWNKNSQNCGALAVLTNQNDSFGTWNEAKETWQHEILFEMKNDPRNTHKHECKN